MLTRLNWLALLLPALLMLPATTWAFGTSPSTCAWRVVKGANPSPYGDGLDAVAAISSSDGWAVGSRINSNGDATGLTEHWNGTTWSAISFPGGVLSNLTGVLAISPNDVWAVGWTKCTRLCIRPIADHWNGSNWTEFFTPHLSYGQFFALSATSSNDVWAVGRLNSATLIEHWNGSVWSVVPSPNNGSSPNALFGIAAIAPDDAWAVGGYGGYGGQNNLTLIERWNGSKWKIVPSPNVPQRFNLLNAIAAISQDDVWGIGNAYTSSTSYTLAEHWNGTAWSIIPSPNVGSFTTAHGVTAVGTSDVWAVGFWNDGVNDYPYSMIWNGTAWSTVAAPLVGEFLGAASVPATRNIWAVGRYFAPTGFTLTEEFHC